MPWFTAPDTPPAAIAPPATRTVGGLRVHAIQTGWVAVKEAHRTLIGPHGLRTLSILVDPRWTGWLPIYAWVIEHPEGIIVVDTGETSRVAEPGYFDCDPGTAFVYNNLLRFGVRPQNEIGAQLATIGIEPSSVRWVVLTHLHSDHAGGLHAFPTAKILLARREYEGSRRGALPCRWPSWFVPTLIDYVPEPVGPFPSSYPLTEDGLVRCIPTPGHSLGHQSVVLHSDDRDVLFGGDVSFTEAQVFAGTLAGICEDTTAARRSLAQVREYVQSGSVVYLPSHDPASGKRLESIEDGAV